jgi:hypothetical protein
VGTVMLVPVVIAFLLTGFPAEAATKDKSAPLADPRIHSRINEDVKQSCRNEPRGSVEYSICLAERRKDAWRSVAETRQDDRRQPALSLR